jgi:Clr5 domain
MTSIIIFSQPTLVPSARSYSNEEWDEKREIITRLYRGDGKTLKEVRVTLADQHDFRPT